MKIFQINLASILIAIACSIALLTSIAHAEDEALPPEVKALVGIKVQAETAGEKGLYIPNFIRFGGGMLNRQIGDETSKAELVYEEGVVGKKWPVFMVSAMHKNGILEVLDARLLPKNKINWRYANGKIELLEKGGLYIFSVDCLYGKGDRRIIFGLEDPRFERDGMSTRIARAWEIDPQSGRIKSISIQGITCAILGE